MRREMAKRGVTPNGYPIWNQQEFGDLADAVPAYALAMPKLPRRTLPAAHSKASREGIARPKAPEWDLNEIPRLRKLYPTATAAELLAAFPGRTLAAIRKAANARKIYRDPKPLQPTGNTVLDQILRRARDQNWSMEQLGAAALNHRYFRHRQWRRGKFNHRAHGLAVKALGGVLRARWFDEA
jgi:hypothetical protein